MDRGDRRPLGRLWYNWMIRKKCTVGKRENRESREKEKNDVMSMIIMITL